MTDVLRGERWRVDEGDCLAWLRSLPGESVQCCITSVPYWQLRSYLPEDHASKCFELGQEPTPEEYVSNMVAVFAEVKRVLRPDGCCFVNVGDSYARNPAKGDNSGYGKNAAWCGDALKIGNYILDTTNLMCYYGCVRYGRGRNHEI